MSAMSCGENTLSPSSGEHESSNFERRPIALSATRCGSCHVKLASSSSQHRPSRSPGVKTAVETEGRMLSHSEESGTKRTLSVANAGFLLSRFHGISAGLQHTRALL